MNRRSVLVTDVSVFIELPGCSLLDDTTQLTLRYNNQTENDVAVSVLLQGNKGIYVDDSLEINANGTYSDIHEVDESGPLLMKLSFEYDTGSHYDHTIGVEEDVTVEIVITESGGESDENG